MENGCYAYRVSYTRDVHGEIKLHDNQRVVIPMSPDIITSNDVARFIACEWMCPESKIRITKLETSH